MKLNRRTRTAVVSGIALLTLSVATPARAETATKSDPADATGSLSDIRNARLNHGVDQVIIKMKFTDLKPTSEGGPSSLAIFLDTNADRGGPEYRLGTGLQTGTDYQLVKTKGFKPVGGPLSCSHSVGIDFAANVVTLRAARTCLGKPEKIRIGAKMIDEYDGSHPISDWLGKPYSFTSWVTAG